MTLSQLRYHHSVRLTMRFPVVVDGNKTKDLDHVAAGLKG